MLYALYSAELLAAPLNLCIYSPQQQAESYRPNRHISTEVLMNELLGMRFLDKTRLVAVPYLQQLIRHSLPCAPSLEAAVDFARTDAADAAIRQTLDSFASLRDAYMDKKPVGMFTIGQAADVLHITRQRLQAAVDLAGIEVSTPEPPDQLRYTVREFQGADLERLYEWQYPASFPDQPFRGDVL